jgi:uncharacterized repeat protein (TIGR01451 family)
MNLAGFPRHLRLASSLVCCGFVAAFSSATAQDFVFTKIVDSNDPIPSGGGALFSVWDQQPALDGGTVVFRNGPGLLAPESIWSVTSTGTFTKLVDKSSAVPGGTGNFSAFIIDFSAPGYPVLSNGTVVFAGRDSGLSGYTGGLYSVPAAGGAISRIANRNVAVPDGTGNFNGGLQYFSVENGRVAFNGVDTAGFTGIYAANTNGTSLVALADSAHPAHPEFPFPIGNFGFPSVSGTTVAFYGNGTFDPSTGYNGLYTTPTSGGFAYGEPATSLEPLPGDPTGVFHTRFGSPRLDGDTIFFRADDSFTNNPNFAGMFSVPQAGGAFTNLADINDTLPGLTGVNSSSSFTLYSAEDGMLAFNAADGVDHYGLYSHSGSTITKVLATGDGGPFADLHVASYAPSIGSQAVDNGSILLFADVRFSARGIYLATPFAASADLASTLSASANATFGSDTTLDISVVNNGPAAATTVSLVVTLPPGLTFKSAAGGTFDAGNNTVTFSVASLANSGSKAFSIVATVDVTGPLTASAYAGSAKADSNLMNNHAFATANTIFASTGNWVVRKIVDNFTPVPDKTGENFVVGNGNDPLPALDGNKIAFVAFNLSGAASVWSANADGSGGFVRLADLETALPGGAGEKFGYMKNVRLRNDDVVFLGFGAGGLHDGFYSVPVEGGAVKSVATTESVRPGGDGAKFGYQDFIQNFTIGYMSDGKMSFVAQSGLYVFPVTGGDGAAVVYPGSNIPMADFGGAGFAYSPAISGTRVVWEGTGGRDALLGSFLDHRHFHALADIATESPSTPGENFVLASQGSFADAQVEGETVVFKAFGGASASIRGIYGVTGQSPIVKLVDTNTDVPGGTGKFIGFTSAGSPDTFALSNGEVVFLGVDEDNRAGFYSVPATGGTITRIVAVGDMIGNLLITGTTGFFQPPMQPNGLGGHQVAFRADYFDTVANKSSPAIFVASRVMNRLANISTRLSVGTGDNVLIGGLIISGTLPKKIVIRGLGPSLADAGVPGVLANPTLELYDGTGKLILSNDNWRDSQEQEIMDTGIPPTNDFESAIVATLDPGFYTAIVRGKNNTTGNGLVEVYDLDPSTDLATRLVNISTRGFVQTGDAVMIGGVIVQGAAEKHLLVRGIGPSLADAGVANALLDPTLDLFDGSGTVVATNDNWRDTQEQAIIDSTVPPTDDRESAVDVHLMPGAYTAIVRGKNDTTGNALVEVYELP